MTFFVGAIFVLVSSFASAQEADEPLWEYGLGIGHVQFEHYPASDQYAYLTLPFPTFQYRGRIVRADDRNGTRAFIFKSEIWSLEFSGAGNFALDASDNTARQGMPNLPWMIMLGPQLIGKVTEDFEVRLGLFQAVSTDFSLTKFNGAILDLKLLYRWNFASSKFFVAYLGRAASQEYMQTYFDVGPQHILPERGLFTSRSGFLSHEFQILQAFKIGHVNFYAGASLTDYSQSVNRSSPLHKADQTLGFVVGLTYVLGESEEKAVTAENTRGIIKK